MCRWKNAAILATLVGILTLVVDAPHAFSQSPRRPAKRVGDLRTPDKLSVGDAAPDFTLKQMDGEGQETLSDYQGKRPVALIFGSYT